jgi:hypothetical protein
VVKSGYPKLYIILKKVILKGIQKKISRRQMTIICGFYYTIYGMQQELGGISISRYLTAAILKTPMAI